MSSFFQGNASDGDIAQRMRAAGIENFVEPGRRGPMHAVHVKCILEGINAHLRPLILIGSTNDHTSPLYNPVRNPLTVAQQKTQLEKALPGLYNEANIITLDDTGDERTWLESLCRKIAEAGGAGKSVVHYRTKTTDAAQAGAQIRALSDYDQGFLDHGLSVWRSHNTDIRDDDISATEIRKYNLEELTDDQRGVIATPDYLFAIAKEARETNPDLELLEKHKVPLTVLDLTFDRLRKEAGIDTAEIIARAEADGHGINLETLALAATALIENRHSMTPHFSVAATQPRPEPTDLKKGSNMSILKIAAAQLDTTACDVAGNLGKIVQFWTWADAKGADLAVTQEQSATGYPLEDKAKNPDLLQAAQAAKRFLTEKSKSMSSALLAGFPEMDAEGHIHNVTYKFEHGTAEEVARKRHLPNDDVFDEKRIYTEGKSSKVFNCRGVKVGTLICEDAWHPDIAADLRAQGAEVLISVNGSPFYAGKHQYRLENVLQPRALETGLPILSVYQVGSQDGLVFDGRTTAMNADGKVAAMLPGFEEAMEIFEFSAKDGFAPGKIHPIGSKEEETYHALVLGVRDYARKTGFKKVLIGMSGGIDSALVAAIAADAVGPDNVYLYKMPGPYSSEHSRTDSDVAAALLGAHIDEINITPMYDAFMTQLARPFNNAAFDSTEENLQARIRGTVLMGLSNKFGSLLLTTGNKSELAVGFCTLYGDMNGGLAVISDVYKMNVYGLSKWRNAHHHPDFLGPQGMVIPEAIIAKEPSAELRPGQLDNQSLPPYPILDPILERYIEQDQSLDEIAAAYDRVTAEGVIRVVEDTLNKVDRNEFKRRQAAPGIKITPTSFGKGRREPIACPTTSKMISDVQKLAM